MILTEKALEAFKEWYITNEVYDELGSNVKDMQVFNTLSKNIKNKIVVDWLDSVRLYIDFCPYLDDNDNLLYFWVFVNDNMVNGEYPNRHEATSQAIITANKIYNERN